MYTLTKLKASIAKKYIRNLYMKKCECMEMVLIKTYMNWLYKQYTQLNRIQRHLTVIAQNPILN